ncbi:undecaprenyldiphospho-muramoylpentapeptide beta-N-acetylglucosaminyltransferase [Miniphocaeibacter halophilus]|uniref:Undecaprenyldiphospho-muramoylpentapeptide beta-N-acetylglucosaminyltransferase n=1 Tax=Miniphocaeibacter halophilus TaxID=2931922 RepID=A0AC61MTG1_9FIRM|nr:undecaprenyldiphospho-muramoylpentapeptide beta-N-acetylglucosaminyltransferase [Miniphocaeibacter halophilus]QQK07511.1 undecaprenyldiphospho-muramoylpentapeptide beta-N-acetylglucosaminyltransferase [Miniphocaeibacter halophilus]
MRAIVTGGGTGGHIYPAVSIIEELKNRDKNIEILYVGKINSMESEIIPKLGIEFKGIRVEGLPRKFNKKSFRSFKELIFGLKQSKKIIKNFKPDIVIGTGGFVTGPVLLNASLMKYKTYFHEQNSYPGVTNKILSRFVNKYFVTFEESIKYFKNPQNAIVTGNPIRNRFKNIEELKDKTYEEYGLKKDLKTIFSFGGSNGSAVLNKTIKKLIVSKEKNDEFQIVHVTGKNNYEDFILGIDEDKLSKNKIFPYLKDIQKAYSIADLVITSSGAITLAELSFLGLPSILVPKSYTTENHQVYNAREFEKVGASKVILENELNENTLYDSIMEIVSNNETIKRMKEAAKTLATPKAVKNIIDEIYKDM